MAFSRLSFATLLFGVWLHAGFVEAGQEPTKPAIPAETWAKIEDDQPLRKATENKVEFDALSRLILKARQLSPEALAEQALPGITGRELFGPERGQYRGRVVHVVGRLTWLEPVEPNVLAPSANVKKLYLAWIQDDTTPEFSFCVLVSELPARLKPAEKIEKVWVTLDGFFFKRVKYRDGKEDRLAPLIVGRSLRRSDGTTETPTKTLLERGDPKLDCPSVWLDHVEDDTPVQGAKENPDEYNAYNYFVLHARKVPPELLAKHARPELTFRVLFQGDRAKYRGEIIRVEGKLLRLEWIGTNASLEAAGVKDLWEAWIFEDGPDGNPTCVVISELPPGIKPAPVIHDTRASFNGYFFKRYKYKAADAVRLAPLAIGRTLTVNEAPPPTGSAASYDAILSGLVPVGIAVVVGLVVALIVFSWWFRRGDRHVRAKLTELKGQTLFRDEPPAAE